MMLLLLLYDVLLLHYVVAAVALLIGPSESIDRLWSLTNNTLRKAISLF